MSSHAHSKCNTESSEYRATPGVPIGHSHHDTSIHDNDPDLNTTSMTIGILLETTQLAPSAKKNRNM